MNEVTTKESISNRRRYCELTGVAVTAAGKFIFMDALNMRLPFIIAAIAGWVLYTVLRSKKVKGILYYWGFRVDNFKDVTLKVLPFGVVAVLVFFTTGYIQKTINLTWHIVPILMLYPLWGTIQQFLMISLIAGNLKDLKGVSINNLVIIISTSVLFSAVHYPNLWLSVGTFILAIFYCTIFLKSRNVFVLGLFHGWLGGLFYYTVVNRDPFIEVFGKMLK